MLSRFEQFPFMISGIYRSIQKIEREEMDKYGLKGGYAQYLAAMARYPEGLTAAQVCEICDPDKAAVSRSTIIGSVIGTHAGPGAIAAAFFKK